MKIVCRFALAAAGWGTLLAGAAQAEVLSSEGLVFHAVTPCRVFDTRLATPPLTPGQVRNFTVVGGSDYSSQGGNPQGCMVPGHSSTRARVQAVMLNFVAVNPSGPGNLRAWSASEPNAPNASILNFTTATIANGIIVPVSQQEAGQGFISVQADGSATHVLADVLGYFVQPDMGSRAACYSPGCSGSVLVGGFNYLWGSSLGSPDITPSTSQTCLVTANVSMVTSLAPSTGSAFISTALLNITDEDSFSDTGLENLASFTYGTGDNKGSASKTYMWSLEANKAYRFGCSVNASGEYVGDTASCHVSWICR